LPKEEDDKPVLYEAIFFQSICIYHQCYQIVFKYTKIVYFNVIQMGILQSILATVIFKFHRILYLKHHHFYRTFYIWLNTVTLSFHICVRYSSSARLLGYAYTRGKFLNGSETNNIAIVSTSNDP
jgi:hypothetical protein